MWSKAAPPSFGSLKRACGRAPHAPFTVSLLILRNPPVHHLIVLDGPAPVESDSLHPLVPRLDLVLRVEEDVGHILAHHLRPFGVDFLPLVLILDRLG